MAKKNFDSFLSTVKAPKISSDEIEEMTREIHRNATKSAAPAPESKPTPKPDPKPAAVVVEKPAPKIAAARGRKPKMPETERMIRVSVDLPESIIINLKIKVTRDQTDMKNYIRLLVERELRKEFGK